MKLMVPTESIVVVREGKRVTPKLQKPYPFTDAEIAFLREHRPEALRAANNESADAMLDLPDETLPSDAEVEAANEQAHEEQAHDQAQRAGERAISRNGGAKAVRAGRVARAAAAEAPGKVDDL